VIYPNATTAAAACEASPAKWFYILFVSGTEDQTSNGPMSFGN
jgi:hypothetical protein